MVLDMKIQTIIHFNSIQLIQYLTYFRSKVKLSKDVPMEWYNYQKDVMDSGALGMPGSGGGDGLNPDAGDYKGF